MANSEETMTLTLNCRSGCIKCNLHTSTHWVVEKIKWKKEERNWKSQKNYNDVIAVKICDVRIYDVLWSTSKCVQTLNVRYFLLFWGFCIRSVGSMQYWNLIDTQSIYHDFLQNIHWLKFKYGTIFVQTILDIQL